MDELAGIAAVPRFKRGADLARAVLGAALDLALPRLCAACREPVEGQGLCPACWSKLSFITRPYCERLGIHFVYDPGPGILSMEAIADPPAYHRARAAVRFDDISRALVHALKYGDRLDLAPMMGRWLSHAGRDRRPRPRAAALAPAVGAMLQPIGHAGRRHLRRERRADRVQCPQTRKGDGPVGRSLAVRTRHQRSGRIPGAARRQGRRSRPAARSRG